MTDPRCQHDRVICAECVIVTDDAKRMADAIGYAVVSHPPEVIRRGWMAFALQDGTTDNVIYPSKTDCIRHQFDEFRYAYICLVNCMGGMPVKDAQLWLDLHRHVHKHGGRLTSPESVIMPQAREQRITRETFPAVSLGKFIRMPFGNR